MFESLIKAFLPRDMVTFEKDWPDFRMYAIRRHGLQQYGDLPYSFHLAMVETCLLESNFTEYHYQAAAWLHDICEDTNTTLEEVVNAYGGPTGSIVWACTGEGKDRKACNASIYKKLTKYPSAAPVKVADRICNMMTATGEARRGDTKKITMYLNEWEEFRKTVAPLMEDERRKLALWISLEEVVDRAKDLLEDIEDLKKEEKLAEQPEPDANPS